MTRAAAISLFAMGSAMTANGAISPSAGLWGSASRADHHTTRESTGRTAKLAERPPAGCHHPSWRDFGDHGNRRRSRDRDQFPAVDAAARLVHGQCDAADLRVVGSHLW